jgi:hypothetical protein
MTLKAADLMRHLSLAAPALRRSLADLERNLGFAGRRSERDYDERYRR